MPHRLLGGEILQPGRVERILNTVTTAAAAIFPEIEQDDPGLTASEQWSQHLNPSRQAPEPAVCSMLFCLAGVKVRAHRRVNQGAQEGQRLVLRTLGSGAELDIKIVWVIFQTQASEPTFPRDLLSQGGLLTVGCH